MNELIAAFTTPYTMQSVNLMLTYTECYACIALFARRFERRDFFLVRIILTLLEGMVVCYLLAIWYTEADSLLVRVLCYSAITVSNFTALMFCWRDDIEEMLLAFCSGMAAYQFTNKLYPLLQNLRGINDRETLALLHPGDASISNLDWTLFFGFHLLSIVVLALLFTPKNRLVNNRRTTRNVIILSIATITLVNILICISRVYEGESPMLNIVTKILYVGFSFTILTICAGIFSQSEQEKQIGVLHQLWRQDRAQFESVKANMDVINMKCHDLKHILDRIEDKLTGEEAASLREAIQFYDANIKTGNEVLDVVLCEKAMTCQKSGISFSCMADGEKLDFLTPVQTYTLFGNIIDNAVEAVKPLPLEERVISLSCWEEKDSLVVEESNYFSGRLELDHGLPATSKGDSSRHGFGTKSIQYIAAQYGGTMDIKVVDNMFFLTVRFPLGRNRDKTA
ncbi:MAG: sensor histidine kinase [Oscillospiraceae bacterium]|nr:sensor histidine kinase [Oscillospiraceae bacterium]